MTNPVFSSPAPALGGLYRDAPFSPVEPSDPGVEAARACAARAARTFWITKRAFLDSIDSTQAYRDSYTRALHAIERRRVEIRTAPGHESKAADVTSPPNPNAIDPWTVERGEQPNSRITAICPGCSGSKKVTCAMCSGAGRLRCPNCNGSGRVYGQRGQKKCPTCRGRGDVDCPECRSGSVDCGTCAKVGRVFAWLEVTAEPIEQVRVHPRGGAASVHVGLDSPGDFDRGTWPNALVSDSGRLPPGATVPEEVQADLDPRSDRLLGSRVQTFAGTVYRFWYGTALGRGPILVAGDPPSVSRASDPSPLRRRRLLIIIGAILSAIAVAAVPVAYEMRDPWFGAYGHGGTVLGSALVAAALVTLALAGMALSRRARSMLRTWIPTALAVASIGPVALAFGRDMPSVAVASSALRHGDFVRAGNEARALERLGVAGGGDILDEIHIRRVQSATSTSSVAAMIDYEPWHSPAKREAAVALLRETAERESRGLEEQANFAGLHALAGAVAPFAPDLSTNVSGREAIVLARQCLARMEAGCLADQAETAGRLGVATDEIDALRADGGRVVDEQLEQQLARARDRDPHVQASALDAALRLATLRSRLTGSPSSPTPEEITGRLERANAAVARDDARAAAQAEAQARREEARQRAAERAASRPRGGGGTRAACCDGTISPSCGCGGGRGCCSHHGGVCGCN